MVRPTPLTSGDGHTAPSEPTDDGAGGPPVGLSATSGAEPLPTGGPNPFTVLESIELDWDGEHIPVWARPATAYELYLLQRHQDPR